MILQTMANQLPTPQYGTHRVTGAQLTLEDLHAEASDHMETVSLQASQNGFYDVHYTVDIMPVGPAPQPQNLATWEPNQPYLQAKLTVKWKANQLVKMRLMVEIDHLNDIDMLDGMCTALLLIV